DPYAVEHAAQVDVHRQVGFVQGHRLDLAENADTGVVDHVVQAAELGDHFVHGVLHVGALGHVDPHGAGGSPGALDLVHHGVQRLFGDVGGQHERALGGQLPGDLSSDAAGRAGDDGCGSGKRPAHADL